MSGTSHRLRRAGEGDLAAIARLHRLAYDRSHFTSLLPEEVLVAYYRYFLDDRTSILLAVRSGDTALSGFAVSGEGIPEKIARFKREHRNAIFVEGLKHPLQSARKVGLQILRKVGQASEKLPVPFLLLSIAVAAKGQGIGRLLLAAVEDCARVQGHDRIGLYVNASNISAINAYVAVGYRCVALLRDQYYMECRVAKG